MKLMEVLRHPSFKSPPVLIGFVLILAGTAWTVHAYQSVQRQLEPVSRLLASPQSESSSDGSAQPEMPPTSSRLYLIFQKADCSQYLAALDALDDFDETEETQVQGLLLEEKDAPSQPRQLLPDRFAASIEFNVRYVEGSVVARILDHLGYRATPILIEADRAGRIQTIRGPGTLIEYLREHSPS